MRWVHPAPHAVTEPSGAMATRSQGEHAKGNIQYGSGVEASWNFGAGLRGVCARFLWSVRLAAWRPLDTELAEPRRRLSVRGLSARVLSELASCGASV